ncbi:hypothetical protein JG687_00010306 [Phytophthora cactorum]|uniref:FHA domain-containing protein n=1 Tax=Phytophthora cactorum TaxID=29920 RepID=A0A8T1U750_9STRA|nr:hypothetical protein JG687_00010306 [Phytophthora cactorum]
MLRDVMMGSWEFSTSFCVGRSRGCEVSIATSEETRTVSKRHVGIVPLTETLTSSAHAVPGKRRWLIYDLETMNGTAVNGVEIPKGGNQDLQNGDEVVLASAMRHQGAGTFGHAVACAVASSDDHSGGVPTPLTTTSCDDKRAGHGYRIWKIGGDDRWESGVYEDRINWFRNSLSCPECRDVVKTVPVRNRALDELVERLVGQTEAYKSLVRRRARMQRRSIGPHRYERGSNESEDVSEGATRGVSSLQLGNNRIPELRLRSSVFTRWSVEDKLAFSAYINDQFGEARVATCKKVGLTEPAVDRANMTELLVAAQNLLLDCGGLRLVGDECCQRLKIFLFFG